MNTPKLEIAFNADILRERILPVPGEVLVELGQEVGEGDLVLRTSLKSEIVNVKVREILNLGQEDISRFFKIKEGDLVGPGDLIFKRPGLFGFFSEELKSPIGGRIEVVDSESGFIGIRPPAQTFEIKAYLRGRVESVVENKSVSISAHARGFLQGVFGVGKEAMGSLVCVDSREELVGVGEGAIIAYPAYVGEEELHEILNLKPKALLVSSVSSEILDSFQEILEKNAGFVMMVVDGFGKLEPSLKLKSFLKEANGKNCSISGQVQVRAGAIRPELIVHEALTEKESVEGDVRIVRGEYMGRVGSLVSYTQSQVEFPSGVKSLGVSVLIDEIERVFPLQNIETL